MRTIIILVLYIIISVLSIPLYLVEFPLRNGNRALKVSLHFHLCGRRDEAADIDAVLESCDVGGAQRR